MVYGGRHYPFHEPRFLRSDHATLSPAAPRDCLLQWRIGSLVRRPTTTALQTTPCWQPVDRPNSSGDACQHLYVAKPRGFSRRRTVLLVIEIARSSSTFGDNLVDDKRQAIVLVAN